MIIDLPLARPEEAERLRTAVYRFSELKRVAPPVVEVRANAGRVCFDSAEQAAEFPNYWRVFRNESRVWGQFLDV
jgi:hypothetical protein